MRGECEVLDGIKEHGTGKHFSRVTWKGEKDEQAIYILMEASKLCYKKQVFDMLRTAGTQTVDYESFKEIFLPALEQKRKASCQLCQQPGWFGEELVTSRRTYVRSGRPTVRHVSYFERRTPTKPDKESYKELKKSVKEFPFLSRGLTV